MNTSFVTKRPHKKSRSGCQTCKSRKIKCDEAQPACSFCASRKIPCNYPPRPTRSTPSSPESSQTLTTVTRSSSCSDGGKGDVFVSWDLINPPTPPVVTSSGTFSAIDLRTMHHWSTYTSNSIGVGEQMHGVLLVTVPELAFENDFLMNGLLGIASLHRQMLLPDKANIQRQTDIYRAKALNGYRKALAQAGPDSPNYDAVLVMSLLLVVLCSQDYNMTDELTVVRWVVMYRGLSTIMRMRSIPDISAMSISPIFIRQITELKSKPMVPTVLLNMLGEVHPMDPDYDHLEDYCNILDSIGLLYASLRQDGLSAALFVRIVSWPSFTTDKFAKMAREKQPRALVILAYYLAFLKLVECIWWVQEIPDRDIQLIARIVGPKWHLYLEQPLRVANISDRQEMANLMLGRDFEDAINVI